MGTWPCKSFTFFVIDDGDGDGDAAVATVKDDDFAVEEHQLMDWRAD